MSNGQKAQPPTTSLQDISARAESANNHPQIQQHFHQGNPNFSTQGAKFLASQVAHFGGTDNEDVEEWLENIENIAASHNLSQVAKLSATTTNLTKFARRWFNLKAVTSIAPGRYSNRRLQTTLSKTYRSQS